MLKVRAGFMPAHQAVFRGPGRLMLAEKKIVVVMPAYNSAATLERTYKELPLDIVDEVIVVDDGSQDNTVEIAHQIGIPHVLVHEANKGYGGNQKTCYQHALSLNADIIVMIHPDYQYSPRLLTALCSLIAEGFFDCTLGSRILGVGALKGGMPYYKYLANRFLTLVQNIILGYKLSEYHTGYRAFSCDILKRLPLDQNSNDFVFDNQMLAQIIYAGYAIGEVACPTRYEPDSSSIGFGRSVIYGLGVLHTSIAFRLHRWGLIRHPLFESLDPSDQP
jgi:glycosyltransferase involved in cell wall biosynthesis